MSAPPRPIELVLREAARVVNVWIAHGSVDTSRRALARWAAETASQTPLLPRPDAGIETLLALRLATTDEDGALRADPLLAGASPADAFDRFPVGLRRPLLERLLRHSRYAGVLRAALAYAMLERGSLTVAWRTVPSKAQRNPAWLWLQELELAAHEDEVLRLDEALRPFVVEVDPGRRSISQAELEERLAAQRTRAWLAEDLVVRLERDRLVSAGASEYAEAVRRISQENALAGYDVDSYEADGHPRSIEVKCSAGGRERFFLSSNERCTAENVRGTYWIAWVGWASRLPAGPCDVAWFRDPARLWTGESSPWRMSFEDAIVERVRDDSTHETKP